MTAFDPYSAQKEAEEQTTLHFGHVETAKEVFEREKASIKSYEEEWDDWDGPIWPKGTVQVDLGKSSTSFPKVTFDHQPEPISPGCSRGAAIPMSPSNR